MFRSLPKFAVLMPLLGGACQNSQGDTSPQRFTLTKAQNVRQHELYKEFADSEDDGEFGNVADHREFFTLADGKYQNGPNQVYVFEIESEAAPEGAFFCQVTVDRETGRILSVENLIAEF